MTENRDDFFKSVFGGGNETFQLAYENRTVRRAINECGVKPKSMGKLVNICRDETGQPFFSFDWFNQFFDAFPATLCGKRIGRVGSGIRNGERQKLCLYQLNLKELLQPDNNLLVRAISAALVDCKVESNRPFVFVFPVVKKMFCAHNMALDIEKGESRAQWVFNHNGALLTVEPTDSVFRSIGSEWYQE
jgi:hypothetical protein